MAQSKKTPGGRGSAGSASGAGRVERRGPPHRILCLLPRGLTGNPLRHQLPDYELAAADTWTAARRLARRTPYDLYILYAPLGWTEPVEVCRRIREFDAHTPIVLYSALPSAAERREALAQRAVQAYVARSDDAHNLTARAGQLIMLAELRSMEALRLGMEAMQAHLARRLVLAVAGRTPPRPATRTLERLKAEACGIFAEAGGSRANFERLWPSLCEDALNRRAPVER